MSWVIIAWIVVQMNALVNFIEHSFDLLKDGWRLGVTEPLPKP